ncbi:MAG: hypothetical protein H6828_14255 [Planctomycetes bacterium]|nr:hypothetical protein [Planctomycetota bacterium]
MTPPSRLDELARLTERLVDCADPVTRDRVLVEALLAGGFAQSAALLRRAEGDEAAGWIEVLARGPRDLLPDAELVAAVARGELDGRLPLARVFVARRGARASALALGGPGEDEAPLELVEALLEVLAAVEGADADAPTLLSILGAPLPASDAGDAQDPLLDDLLTGIRTTEALLHGELDARDDAALASFLDHERHHLAELLGDVLRDSASDDDDDASVPGAELDAWHRSATKRAQRAGVHLDALLAPALARRGSTLAAGALRAGLARLELCAFDALAHCPPGRRRLAVTWTASDADAGRLVFEDSAPHVRGEDLGRLARDLAALGLDARVGARDAHGLRVELRVPLDV